MLIDYLLQALFGLFIGVCVSVPIGPAGALCVRRTLEHGRRSGFLMGVGAAIGDVVYGGITYCSTSLLYDYLIDYRLLLRVGTSVLCLAIAAYFYFNSPRLEYKSRTRARVMSLLSLSLSRSLSDIGSGLALTIVNVAIVFFYVMLFSQFNFVYPLDEAPLMFVVGVLSVALGAMLWWFFLSSLVDRLREHISPMLMRTFNNVLALVMVVIGLGGLLYTLVLWLMRVHVL